MSQQKADDDSKTEQLFLEYKKQYMMVTCNEKLNCSFDCWYTKFKKQTIKSRLIPINQTFIDYLKKDGLKLPPQIQSEMDNYYELDSDQDSDYEHDKTFNSKPDQHCEDKHDDIDYSLFDELFVKIRTKIKALKGAVIPKLNWSAPKDAKWINGQTLRCDNITQILLLLKSSQFVQHDLFYPFHGCFDYNSNDKETVFEYKLILRKYCNLYPNREFRCFIYKHDILAITQRIDDDVFTELQSEINRNKISECIELFFNKYVANEFTNDKYVMDVYIDKEFKVYIIDFNPFYEFTDCGTALSWIDICKLIEIKEGKKGDKLNKCSERIRFGYVDCDSTAKIKFDSNSQYRYPIDAVDLRNEKHINEFVDSCKNKQ